MGVREGLGEVRGVAVRVMAATAAVMAGARLGIVLLTFGMTPVLVLLVMAPKGGGAAWGWGW